MATSPTAIGQRLPGKQIGPFAMTAVLKAVAAAMVLLLACWHPAAMAQKTRPNVVLVYFDDLNDWVQPFAPSQSATPHLTAFAERSTVFANAMTPSPVCNPSRVAMLTGVHPTRSGVYDNEQVYPNLGTWISSARNLPQHFRDNGYIAAGYGKIFHHRHTSAYAKADYWTPGYSRLWSDDAENALPEAAVLRFDMPGLKRHSGILGDDWDRDDPTKMQQDTVNTLSAIDFVGKSHDRPFFLALGIYRPHTNWYAAKRYWDRFPTESIRPAPGILKDDLADVPAYGRKLALDDRSNLPAEAFADYNNLPPFPDHSDEMRNLDQPYLERKGLYNEAARGYLASIAYADDMFGRFIEALDKSKYAENTIVIVVSDHGYHLGEKDHWHKATMWERSIRVPFMIRNPVAPASAPRVETPVSLLDVYPTIVDLAGLSRPRHELGGQSLRPLLEGQRTKGYGPVLTTLYPGYHSVRDDSFRYIRYPDGTRELYALASDPWEWNNLARQSQFDAVMKRLDAVIPKSPAALVKQAGK